MTIAWASQAWPEHCWDAAQVQEGAFHTVLVLADVVARISKRAFAGAGERTERERACCLAVVGLTTPAPKVLGPVVELEGRAGFLTTRVGGAVDGEVPWERLERVLPGVLADLGSLPRAGAPDPRTWAGGADWESHVDMYLLPLLSPAVAVMAQDVVDAVLACEAGVEPAFVHGDLTPYNLLWSEGELSGIIDFDHACWGDPAIDLAPLVGMFGVRRLRAIASDEVLERATLHRASLALQVAAAAHLVQDKGLRNHVLASFSRRCAEGTLYGPAL